MYLDRSLEQSRIVPVEILFPELRHFTPIPATVEAFPSESLIRTGSRSDPDFAIFKRGFHERQKYDIMYKLVDELADEDVGGRVIDVGSKESDGAIDGDILCSRRPPAARSH